MLLFKGTLLIFVTLLYTSNAEPQCSTKKIKKELKSSVDIVIEEFLTAQQHMENYISENLKNTYGNVLTGIQNSTKQIIDTQSTEIRTLTEVINETNAGIVAQSKEIITLKEVIHETNAGILEQSNDIMTLNEVINGTNAGIIAQSTDIMTLKEVINENNAGILSQSNEISLLKEIIDVQSNAISSLQSTLSINHNILAEIRSNIEILISRMKPVPSGFIIYNGHIVLLPRARSGSPMNWQESIDRCSRNGAIPFIPRTLEDFRYIQQVKLDIGSESGSGSWIPANDLESEGVINWYDGTSAETTLRLFDWQHGLGYAGDNNDGADCVNIWNTYDNKLELWGCTGELWPMICEII